ncbi:MAG TPA: hypothetical protein VGN41_01010 [Streptosporangiaceae bacterium]|jgi:hypothetical protein
MRRRLSRRDRHPRPGTGRRLTHAGQAGVRAAAVTLGIGVLAACSASAGSGSASASTTCGTTRTAANVPVIIKVGRGSVSCGTAMRVENSYAAAVRAGKIRGNGGGAPVTVSGWTCQGFPTPEVLRTGQTSACRTNSAEVLAILPPPSGTAPSAPPT